MAAASVIEVPLHDGRILRVRFQWRGDRFGHVIELDAAGQTQTWLESCEGTPDDFWPASPPFQALSIEPDARGEPAALLVGMAGPNHWSASVTRHVADAAIEFDVACRTRQRPERLGSTYIVHDLPPGVRFAASSDTVVESAATSLTATPTLPELLAFPTTIRWRYRVL